MKVLLIEDNEADAYIIEEAIAEAASDDIWGEMKFKSVWADSLEQAYLKVNEEKFDLLILDLNLRDSVHSGLETLSEVLEKGLNIPIVVMTGDTNAQLWSDALRMGAQDYIIKGLIDPINLVRTLSHALERFALIKQIEANAERLEESNKELESFAYVASHDLREPLRKISAFGDRLVESSYNQLGEQGRDYIDRMQSATERMAYLLDDLLDFSRLSRKNLKLEKIPLNKLLNVALCDLEISIKKSQANINLSQPFSVSLAKNGVLSSSLENDLAKLGEVYGDETQLLRALENLISNSIKYHKPNQAPTITVSVIRHQDSCEISIEDQGIGFEMEYKDKIFEQFERLHGKSEYEGSGMGLSIVKKIIEKHDGSIDVASEVNVGSKFTIKLPVFGRQVHSSLQPSH